MPPHEEQRRAHRRAGRRQDGHRRRARAEDRVRRRTALSRRQAHSRARHFVDCRRHEVSRAVRRAPQGDHEGAHGQPEHHRLHRRAAYAGRCGLGRRLARRGQHPEARAVAWRDSLHRRDDARRVPEVHREGSLARAPVPGHQGGSARRAGDDRDHPRREGSIRVVPPRRIHARSHRGGGVSVEPLHHRSVPARQGDRSHRRGRRPREAARGGLQRGIRRDQPQHSRRRRADGKRGVAEGLREGAVLSRAGSERAREPAVRAREVRRQVEHAPRGGRQAGDRRGRFQVDRRAACVDQSGRRRQAAAHGAGAPPPRGEPGARDLRGVTRDPPLASRAEEPQSSRRQLHVPRADRASARPSSPARSRISCSAATTR